MGKKTEKLRRIVDKLGQRYGADDSDVQRLQSELDGLEAFEFCYPNKYEHKSPGHAFSTRARQLYVASGLEKVH